MTDSKGSASDEERVRQQGTRPASTPGDEQDGEGVHAVDTPGPDSPPADHTGQPAEPTAPDALSGARVAGRGLPPLLLAALRRSVRRDPMPPLPAQRAAAALRRSRELRRREGR